MLLRTYVAPLLTSFGKPIKSSRRGEPGSSRDICWLDELLKDGFKRPDELGDRPLEILIHGPPGAGKSILVQQICCSNAVRNEAKSLIITTETTARAFEAGMRQLRLIEPDKIGIISLAEEAPPPDKPLLIAETTARDATFADFIGQIQRHVYDLEGPEIVVIDSINVMKSEFFNDAKATVIDKFKGYVKFLICVLDTATDLLNDKQIHDFQADTIIELGHRGRDDGYFTRYCEITKARHQLHVLGRHVMKILKPIEPLTAIVRREAGVDPIVRRGFTAAEAELSSKPSDGDVVIDDYCTDPEGARPYQCSGGVFVFPSVHFILSEIRSGKTLVDITSPRRPMRTIVDVEAEKGTPLPWGPLRMCEPTPQKEHGGTPPTESPAILWPVAWCHELAGGPVPQNQCTALIGRHGARKSYFAYQFLMDGICNGEQTLLVSFRDNPKAVRETFEHIAMADQYKGKFRWSDENPTIVYQRPGFVTPEELMHRVVAAIGENAPPSVPMMDETTASWLLQ